MADDVHYAQLNLPNARSQKPNLPSRARPRGLHGSEEDTVREERTILEPGGDGAHELSGSRPIRAGRCAKIQDVSFAVLSLTCVLFGIIILYLTLKGSSCTCPAHEGNITNRLQEMDRKLKCMTERTQGKVSLREIHHCPENWTMKDEMCYYFSEQQASRDQSDKFCMSYEARLATVRSSQPGLLNFVKNLGKDFWIGLKKERRDTYEAALWYWTDNNTELQVKKDAEHMTCAKLAGEVTAEPCTSKLRWICEKEAETRFYKTISDCL